MWLLKKLSMNASENPVRLRVGNVTHIAKSPMRDRMPPRRMRRQSEGE